MFHGCCQFSASLRPGATPPTNAPAHLRQPADYSPLAGEKTEALAGDVMRPPRPKRPRKQSFRGPAVVFMADVRFEVYAYFL